MIRSWQDSLPLTGRLILVPNRQDGLVLRRRIVFPALRRRRGSEAQSRRAGTIIKAKIGFVVRSAPLGRRSIKAVRTALRMVSVVLVERIIQGWDHFLFHIDLLTVISQTKPAANRVSSESGNLGILLIRKQEGKKGLWRDNDPAPGLIFQLHCINVHDLEFLLRDGSQKALPLIL